MRSGSIAEPDLVSVISFRVDDLNRAAEVAKEIEAGSRPRLS